MLISVIVSTYNRPDALCLILQSFNYQTDKNFEVVIADDGSDEKTRKLVAQMTMSSNYKITYVRQEDLGFRLARIRNLAALNAKGEYLVFLDGDCIPRPTFIETHRKLSSHNYLVAGNRILLSEEFTKSVLENKSCIWTYSFFKWIQIYLRKGINRLHPLIVFPYFQKLRDLNTKWKKARGCNFALYKTDYERVNGCDSDFTGWGYEDSDLAIRLIHAGVKIKSGRYATGVFHLYHKENDRSNEKQNLAKLNERLNSSIVESVNGLKEVLKS